jgi:hypothetical protein
LYKYDADETVLLRDICMVIYILPSGGFLHSGYVLLH